MAIRCRSNPTGGSSVIDMKGLAAFKHRPHLGVSLVLGVTLAASVALNASLYRTHQSADEHLLYFPNARALHVYAMGFENFAANVLWMRTLAYFGGHLLSDQDFRYLAYMLDIITRLNPYHRSAYYMASSVLPWVEGGLGDSLRLGRRAMAYLPKEGRWPYHLGLNAYLFQDQRQVAVHYLERAVKRGYSHRWTAALAIRLRTEAGKVESAAQFLRSMLQRQQDAGMRKYLEGQLRSVETELVIRRLEKYATDMSGIDDLRRAGLRWPHPLPDGGQLVMSENGRLYSSHTPGRLKLFRSRRAGQLQSEARKL